MGLEHAHEQISAALRRLSKLFTDECRLSFVMRHPTMQDCYLVVTDDDPNEVAATLRYHAEKGGR